ncbi:MAG: DUF2911 domain-containing protein [Acidobacteriota bacterium]|nr:DUF2911 domain-containing protein [Acidobacteriota bacterium]
MARAPQLNLFAGLAAAGCFISLASLPASAQGLTLPPSGDNQKASVTQHIGLVKVTVSYSSPRVHREGQDRTGKIWGGLVPYGLSDLGFNDCKECPWRAGANENTVFKVTHDVKIEGKPLPAGSYGLHMIPGADKFTVIFSKDSSAWGSYWYNPQQDALRVDVLPAKDEFHEWLTYEFTERESAKAKLELRWENLRIPISISVDDPNELYFQNLRKEMHGAAGFQWSELMAAAQFTLQSGKHLDAGLDWAQRAAGAPFVGNENFQTLSTLGQVQLQLGNAEAAQATFDKAIANPSAKPTDAHQLGRQLLQQGHKAEALKIFQANAKKFPGQWPVNVGLARGYAASGDLKKALEHARMALAQAPDEPNKKALNGLIEQLEKGAAPR